MILKPKTMNGSSKSNTPSSPYSVSKNSTYREPTFSSLDTARVANLKNENRELMRTLGILDSSLSLSRKTSNNIEDQPEQKQTNKEPAEGRIRKTIKDRILENSKNLPERKEKRESPVKEVNKKPKVPSYEGYYNYSSTRDDDEREGSFYFQHTDFDDFVASMARPMRQDDVRNKVLELKDLAKSMKTLAEAPSEENVEKLLQKFMRDPTQKREKPFYKKFLEGEKGSSNSKGPKIPLEETLKEKQPPSSMLLKPKGISNNSKNPFYLSDASPIGTQTPFLLEGFSSTNTEKENNNTKELEILLTNQGLGTSASNRNNTGDSPYAKRAFPDDMSPITPNNVLSALSPGLLQEILEYKPGNINGGQNEATDLISSLQFFLLQNLREIGEIKTLMKDGEGSGPGSKLFSKKAQVQKSVVLSEAEVNPLAESRTIDMEKKVYETQIERLSKKLQTLNKKIQEVEKENERYIKLDGLVKRSLKAGKVKLSDYIKWELDVNKLSVEEISSDFDFEEKFLVISSSYISIEPKGVEKDDAKGTFFEENNYRLYFDDIEYIAYVERPGSCYFLIKSNEAEKERSKQGDSIRTSSGTRGNPFDNKAGFYIVQIEDQREIITWELAFFMVNWKILARNIQFAYNRKSFLQTLQSFINRYLEYNGEVNQIFGDALSINSSKPPLHPSLGNTSKLSISYDPIADIANESIRGSDPNPIQSSHRPSVGGLAGLVNKVQTLMKNKPEELEPKENSGRRTLQKQTKSLPPRKNGGLIEEEAVESDQIQSQSAIGSNQGGQESQSQMRVPSIEEGAGGFEDNKSNLSIRSNNREKKKAVSPEVEEQQTFSRYLTFLLEGAAFEKFGKWGPKHERLIRVSNDFTGLEWRDPKKPKKLPDFILIESIMRIEVGSRSAYFQKKKMSDADRELCLTIVSTERDLNLMAPDVKKREFFVEALQYVLNEKSKLKKISQMAKSSKKEKEK